jgi:hypothetical protein
VEVRCRAGVEGDLHAVPNRNAVILPRTSANIFAFATYG